MIALTVRNVGNSYYDLMYSIGNLRVQRQSLDLALQSLKDNRARVEIGTMAPLDIVQAEAEVATREEAVILAEAAIERQQDAIRALIFNPQSADFWTARIEPTEPVTFAPTTVDTDGAVKAALSQRTDLVVARKNIESNDVNIRYFDNQKLPDVNASVNYGARPSAAWAVAGPSSGLVPGPTTGTVERSTGTRWARCSGGFPGLDAVARRGLSDWPFEPGSQARAGAPGEESSRAPAREPELAVTTQVRDAARNVQTNAKRVDATRSSRVLAERRLEAEEKKYQAGMTQNFFVLQAQRDLNVARNNELLALVEYAKSVVNYSAVQQTPLAGGSQQPQQQQQQ